MEQHELKFTRKRRNVEAPFCPCGKEQSKTNPGFSPFEGFDGKYGYCHVCDQTFLPNNKKDVEYKYTPPPKAVQKFVPEPVPNWIFPDVTIDPIPEIPRKPEGKFYVTFYFRNIDGKICTSKRMLYDMPEFKRDHNKVPNFPHTRDAGYYPCLFQERDLKLYPSATVILVESEKTAALLRRKFKDYLEEFIYIAVGGANGLTDDKIGVLAGRTILICYDCDNGEPQEDGTVKGPKGREAAAAAYLKLVTIASPTVIDIDPSCTDGKDLGDTYKEFDIDYVRQLHTMETGLKKIPEALVEKLRQINRDGEIIDDKLIQELGKSYEINPEKVLTIARGIQKRFAFETGITEAALIQRIEHWLGQRYDFRRNTITAVVQYRKKPDGVWKACNSNDLWRDLHYNIQDLGGKKVKIPRSDIDNILDSEFVPNWNPFEDYFHSLPPWDGRDQIDNLANHVTCTDQNFWRIQFKKAMVRSIACTLDGIDNRIVMVLVGEKQNMGKSWFIRHLCPPALDAEYYKETPLTHDKDSSIALTENFIWNLEELDDLNKKEIAALKAIISTSKVKERRAYGRYAVSMRRIVNFWGSTNKSEFLTDTENTRWLCFTVEAISHDYNNRQTGTKNVDIDACWAQAWHLYNTGFNYRLSSDEKDTQATVNRTFETMSEEKQLIMRYFNVAKPGEPLAEYMQNVEILEILSKNTAAARLRIDGRNIGRAMAQLEFIPDRKSINGRASRGWWVKVYQAPQTYDAVKQPTMFAEVESENGIDLPF